MLRSIFGWFWLASSSWLAYIAGILEAVGAAGSTDIARFGDFRIATLLCRL